ncbi:hypothetical protein [Rudanella paleaurantiibacter]|nr:hypothetical protein [Rudanella paleaurantiibacter]
MQRTLPSILLLLFTFTTQQPTAPPATLAADSVALFTIECDSWS